MREIDHARRVIVVFLITLTIAATIMDAISHATWPFL